MVERFNCTSIRRMTAGGRYINLTADVVLHSDYAKLESELATLRAENEALRRDRDEANERNARMRHILEAVEIEVGNPEGDAIVVFAHISSLQMTVDCALAHATAAHATVEVLVKALEEIADPAMGSHGCATDEELHAYWRDEAIRHRAVASAALSNHRSQK